jgi:hypothetical protein
MGHKTIFLVFILLLSISLVAQDRSPGSETGDAVFRPLSIYDPGWQQWYVIGHAALYRNSNSFADWDPLNDITDSDLEHSVIQATGEGTEVNWQTFQFFLNGFQALGGGCTYSNKPTIEIRKNLIKRAIEQYRAVYPKLRLKTSENEWYYPKIMTPNSAPGSGDGCFRCDALVEYCYEQEGMRFFTEEEKYHCWFRDSEGSWIGFPIFYPTALKKRMTPEAPTPPGLEVSSPADGEIIEDNVNIQFTVDDGSNGSGIDIVYIFIDNRLVHKDDEDSDESKDVEYVWDCSDVDEGNHYIKIDTYDRAGNLAEKEITVYKGEAPIVTSTDPPDAAREVKVDKNLITITFSKPMDAATTTPAVSADFGFTTSWDGEETIKLNLTEKLEYCKEYTVTVSDAATDTSGIHLDGDENGEEGGNYEFTFTTEKPPITVNAYPVAAHVDEGQSVDHHVVTSGGKLKDDVECKIEFDVNNPGGWLVSGANDEDFTLSPQESFDKSYTVSNNGATASLDVSHQVGAECSKKNGEGYFWSAQGHMADHPDENQSPGKMEYPTPWLISTQSSPLLSSKTRGDSIPVGLPDIGILLSGWADGYGHILGKYGIETLPVKPDLQIINHPDIDISDSVKLLVIGSAGLAGLNSPTFKQELEEYVVNGGNLLVLTQRYGDDLAWRKNFNNSIEISKGYL